MRPRNMLQLARIIILFISQALWPRFLGLKESSCMACTYVPLSLLFAIFCQFLPFVRYMITRAASECQRVMGEDLSKY